MTDETTADVVAEAVAAISPDGLPRRRARRVEEPEAPAAQPTAKYIVINGAIAPFGGGRSALVQPGSVVALTSDQAKHYNKLGYLKPYIED